MMKYVYIALLSILCMLSFAIPFMIDSKSMDIFYACGTTLSIGSILILVSKPLLTIFDNITASAGVFFIGLSFIFGLNFLTDSIFKSYEYVLFITIITIICFLILLFRHMFTRY